MICLLVMRSSRWSLVISALIIIYIMKILLWNNRGASNKSFLRNYKDMLKANKPDIFVVVVSRVSGEKSR